MIRATVVIPTCGRPDRLAACLRALRHGGDILVTDDGRDDAARDRIAAEFPGVRWTRGPGRGPAANRNHGAREASGEWVFFLDDDCLPCAGWAEAMARAAEGGEADVVEGKTVCPDPSDDPFEERVENGGGGLLWSCNLGIRRELFLRVGGFDEDFLEAGGEDMEFAWRIARAGLRVSFAPEAEVRHPARRSGWRGLWRRTWMIRWLALYDMKTGHAPRRTGVGLALWRARSEGVRLVRETVADLAALRAGAWRRPLFSAGYRLALFPLVLLYLMYWDAAFRRASAR